MQTVANKKENQKIQRLVLENGITLISVENQAADVIAGRIFLKNAGGRWEIREKAGLSHLLATVITKGTEKLNALEIAEKVESIGAGLGASAAADYFLLSIKTVTADFGEMLKLAGEIMRSPSFPVSEIELEKRITQQNIRSQLEQPFNIAFNQLREAMYQNHPYGMSILGTETTVSGLTRADLFAYHQQYFRPDNLVISLAGRITPETALKMVEEVFGDWEIPTQPIAKKQIEELFPVACKRITPQETQQSIVMLGYLTPGVKTEEYAALKLLSTYLGNGLSSRLFVELREKRGLAYDVSAIYPTRLDYSQFVVYIGTAPENTATAFEGLSTEVKRLCNQQLTLQELQGAKNKILGQYALGKQTNAEIAQIYGWYETLGLGVEFDSKFQENVAEVTAEMAQKVAQEYLQIPYVSLVGPEAVVEGDFINLY